MTDDPNGGGLLGAINSLGESIVKAAKLKVDAEVAKGRGDLDFALWLNEHKDMLMLALTAAGVLVAVIALRKG
ncbi:MAG: hypothetical protein ACT4P4_25745 [Betaproteobacteria bacterium]